MLAEHRQHLRISWKLEKNQIKWMGVVLKINRHATWHIQWQHYFEERTLILIPGSIKMWLLVAQWPVHTKPMHPACSYVKWGCLRCYACQTQTISKHFTSYMEKGGRNYWEKNEKRPYKYRKSLHLKNIWQTW